MNNKEIYEHILKAEKGIQLVEFYQYPTAGVGEVIAETYNYNGQEYDFAMKTFISLVVGLGAAAAKQTIDNKIAVKALIGGLDFPVFFCQKDGRFCITKEVIPMDKQKPVKIHWQIY